MGNSESSNRSDYLTFLNLSPSPLAPVMNKPHRSLPHRAEFADLHREPVHLNIQEGSASPVSKLENIWNIHQGQTDNVRGSRPHISQQPVFCQNSDCCGITVNHQYSLQPSFACEDHRDINGNCQKFKNNEDVTLIFEDHVANTVGERQRNSEDKYEEDKDKNSRSFSCSLIDDNASSNSASRRFHDSGKFHDSSPVTQNFLSTFWAGEMTESHQAGTIFAQDTEADHAPLVERGSSTLVQIKKQKQALTTDIRRTCYGGITSESKHAANEKFNINTETNKDGSFISSTVITNKKNSKYFACDTPRPCKPPTVNEIRRKDSINTERKMSYPTKHSSSSANLSSTADNHNFVLMPREDLGGINASLRNGGTFSENCSRVSVCHKNTELHNCCCTVRDSQSFSVCNKDYGDASLHTIKDIVSKKDSSDSHESRYKISTKQTDESQNHELHTKRDSLTCQGKGFLASPSEMEAKRDFSHCELYNVLDAEKTSGYDRCSEAYQSDGVQEQSMTAETDSLTIVPGSQHSGSNSIRIHDMSLQNGERDEFASNDAIIGSVSSGQVMVFRLDDCRAGEHVEETLKTDYQNSLQGIDTCSKAEKVHQTSDSPCSHVKSTSSQITKNQCGMSFSGPQLQKTGSHRTHDSSDVRHPHMSSPSRVCCSESLTFGELDGRNDDGSGFGCFDNFTAAPSSCPCPLEKSRQASHTKGTFEGFGQEAVEDNSDRELESDGSEEEEEEEDSTDGLSVDRNQEGNGERYSTHNQMEQTFVSCLFMKKYYAAYLCCASDDLLHFGLPFHEMLEKWGFRIFIAERDLLVGDRYYDSMAEYLEERCNGKAIVVLSKNYENSNECLFLTYFAKTLDPDSKKASIIPVLIDKGIKIPSVLAGISIINYNYLYKCRWLKSKLINAIAA